MGNQVNLMEQEKLTGFIFIFYYYYYLNVKVINFLGRRENYIKLAKQTIHFNFSIPS